MLTTDYQKLADGAPPQDLEAERGVVASMMLCQDDMPRLERIRRLVWPAAFVQPDHRILFEGMFTVVDSGRPLDLLLLHAELRARGVWEEIGGAEHVRQILDSHFTPLFGEHYAAIVADRAREREVIRVCMRAAAQMINPPGTRDPRKVIRKTIDALSRAAGLGGAVDVFSLETILQEFIEQKEAGEAVHLATGVDLLDQFRGLFCYGKYTVAAGRPSMGKSTFIRWLLKQFASAGITCGLVSVEEDRSKIAGNYLSTESGVENDQVAYGTWGEHEWVQVTGAVARLAKLPIFGTDTAFSLEEVVDAFDTLAIQHKCRVIAIDHLHLIQHSADTRERELTQISGAIKQAGKVRGVCTIAAAQQRRPEAGRVPPPPQLSDLRASGSIEEHADGVILLHRPDYYRKFEPGYQPNGLCQFLIPKNRNGKTGDAILRAELQYQRFAPPPEEIPDWMFREQ